MRMMTILPVGKDQDQMMKNSATIVTTKTINQQQLQQRQLQPLQQLEK